MAAALGKETGPAGEGAILAGRKPDLGHPQDELQQAVIQFSGQLGQGTFLAQAQIAQQHAQYAINADEQRRPERQAGVVIEHQCEAEKTEDAAQDRIDTGGGCQGLDLGDGHDAGRQVAGGIALEKAHRQAQHPVHHAGLQRAASAAFGPGKSQGTDIVHDKGRATQHRQHQADLDQKAHLVAGNDGIDHIGGADRRRQAKESENSPGQQDRDRITPAARQGEPQQVAKRHGPER